MAESGDGGCSNAEKIVLDMFTPIANKFVAVLNTKDEKISELEGKILNLVQNNQVLYQKGHESQLLYKKEKEKSANLTTKYVQLKRSYRANYKLCEQFADNFKKTRLANNLSDEESHCNDNGHGSKDDAK